ncbi:hypothetical protein ES703_101740 [subsurface metagenome]
MSQKIKATKLDVLEFIKKKGLIEIWQLRDKFNYSDESAYKRLQRLKKQGLVINMPRGSWELTEEGYRRLRYYGKR